MNCPVCNRNNAVTLSICPSCGAMINDSVREELVGKISNAAKPFEFESKGKKMMQNKPTPPATISHSTNSDASPPAATAATETDAKPAAPTLIEFHSKNATVPEWRLQLQNVVRQRQERGASETEFEAAPPRAQLVTNGANALKAEINAPPKNLQHKNPTLNSALERIEKSRRQFLADEESAPTPVPEKVGKNYPFYIAAKTSDTAAKPAAVNAPVTSFAKPKLATSLRSETEKLDTNKMPPLPSPPPPTASVATSFESRPVVSDEVKPPEVKPVIVETKKIEVFEVAKTEVEIAETIQIVETPEPEVEEFDDCAPFAMRFNAGLFDLIIGTFASLLLLSPFMLWGGNWASVAGLFATLATCAIVMFVYLTTSIGLYGKTAGMRLFSLEIIDIENEDYPTFHQAATSSAVYLLSLALGGIGFLSVPFNEDKRAVHDLVSGTIIVKE